MATPFDSSVLQDYLSRWQAGDRAAGDDLVRSIMARLHKLARKMLRGFPQVRSMVDSDDVLQNSLIRLLHSLRRIKPATTRDFFNLAAVHIRRELIDIGRKVRRSYGTVPLDHTQHDLTNAQVCPDTSNSDSLDRWVHFHIAVDQLPIELREVVGLVFYHGWTQPQIAALFSVDVRTVRRRWGEALKKLRKIVGSDFFEK